jgi:aldehyde:ferredoxin oxidoreductase
MIIVEGKSDKPVYLCIKDDAVEIKDASHLWGLDVHETTEKVVEEFGESKAKVSCIGPAGEKLSKVACIMNDRDRAAGRSGVGAVMGSKNLKAVIVRGTNSIELDEKEKFRETVREKTKKVKEDGVSGEGLPALGTKVLDNIINQGGLYPTNNFQFGTFKDVAEVSGEALVEKKYLVKNKACYSCPIACARYVELPDGEKGEGPEYETGWAYGADCGVKDLFAVTKANFLCNRFGLDTISAGCTIATAMELYEKGYIPKEDLENGPEPVFGSSEAIVYYTKKMAYREGKLGNLLAEGSYRLAETYGHPELAMVVKKQELPAYDPRGVQGHGLQYATSNRGGCHVRGYIIAPEILGYPEKLDSQTLEGKPKWVTIFQDLTAVIDALGFCLFTSFPFGAEDYCDMLNAATGFDMTAEELLKVGERIWNLERKFNLDAGISPEEDTLPPRFFNEPLPDGPQKGAVSRMKEILPEYYQLRGWDEKGYIPDSKLQELAI